MRGMILDASMSNFAKYGITAIAAFALLVVLIMMAQNMLDAGDSVVPIQIERGD